MTTALSPVINNEAACRNIKRWVEGRLKGKRIFRKLRVAGEMSERTGVGWIQITVHDGMTALQTKKLDFHAATMTWERLYGLIKDDLMAVFSAHLDKMLAPELVLPGTVPVDVLDAETDGEERYPF